jgi:hypothetical protein
MQAALAPDSQDEGGQVFVECSQRFVVPQFFLAAFVVNVMLSIWLTFSEELQAPGVDPNMRLHGMFVRSFWAVLRAVCSCGGFSFRQASLHWYRTNQMSVWFLLF